jgi:hypothetical protein
VDGLEVLMFQWLWKQKYRVDRGMAMVSGLNTLLLLCQSERLAAAFGMSLGSFVLFAAPLIAGSIWAIGYLTTRPWMQRAEDGAIHELTPSRRDTQEILRLLKEMQK